MPGQVEKSGQGGTSGEVRHCDVIILGSGLAGSVSASILARHGADVVLIDATSHPRFAIGESVITQMAEWLHILSIRYDVPELRSLLSVRASTKDIGPVFGTKRNFGFVKHRPGMESDPHETTQLAIPKFLPQASHLFRQDSDAFMFHVAVKYGCTTRQNWRATDVELDEDGVTVTGQNGEAFRCRYLIDASGFRSPLAEKLGLREKPARFKHHSRSMFTHYIGVKPFDDVSGHPDAYKPPRRWHQGTLHHLIDRGWFWIIPFDNYQPSKNPLCSVGLTFDERTYPRPTDMTAEEEFNHHLDMYPSIKRQFEGARRVREWVATGDRLQYSSKRSVGHRWCLMSHAAGFLDPLYSRGLSNTFEVINALSYRLLEALEEDDFSVGRFEFVERLEQGLLHYNDELVNSSFIAFSNFRLWNAVFRVWGFSTTLGGMRLTSARLKYQGSRDDQVFRDLEKAPHTGLWVPESDKLKDLLETTAETCEKYEAGVLDGDAAADVIFKLLRESGIVDPVMGWKDPGEHHIDPTIPKMARFMRWVASGEADPEMKEFGAHNLGALLKVAATGRNPL